MTESLTDQFILLSDGRKLGFQSLGDPKGNALFFFHGTPGSRLTISQDDRLAQIPGTHLIIPDRPGYGISDPKSERTLLDWSDDVAALADHLGLDNFSVAGESGGGPHTLAVAAGIPHRINKAFVFCSPAPARFKGVLKGMGMGNRIGLFLNQYFPYFSASLLYNNATGFINYPDKYLKAMRRQLPASDQVYLDDPAFKQAIIRDYLEAYRQEAVGHISDTRLTLTRKDWGFDLAKITVPVYLWQGEEDTLVSSNMARYLAQVIPNCEAFFLPDAGHFLIDRPDVVAKLTELLHAN